MPSPRPSPTPGALIAAATSAAMIAHQVAGKATRDALFLSSFHVVSLPGVMAAAAVLSMAGVLALSRLMGRHAPATILPVLFGASACGLAGEWAVGLVAPRLSAVLVYFHTALVGPAVISAFWSVVNERFDPHTAKLAVARIAGGGTLGGVLGGLLAWRAASLVELSTMLLVLSGLHAACVAGALMVRARREPRSLVPASSDSSSVGAISPLSVFHNAPFLRNLALLVALGAATTSLLDYVFSVEATQAFGTGAPLLSFFSLFWLSVSVLSFGFQLVLGRVALEHLGLAVNIAILPGIIVLGGAFGIAVPGLLSSALLRGAEAIQRNTLFRSAYELLYAPLLEQRKRATKALIDIGFDRFGTVVGSGLVLLVLWLRPVGVSMTLLGIVVALALLTLPVARKIHLGYLGALEEALRDGARNLDLPPLDSPDRATERIETVARDKLIERVEHLQASGVVEGVRGQPSAGQAPASAPSDRLALLGSEAADLVSNDAERARRALATWSAKKAPLASFAILLLAHETLHPDALRALRSIAELVTGQLVDALLDPTMAFVVRRRIPRALANCATQRAAEGLLSGMMDARFEVRYECARALEKVTIANPTIAIPREKAVAAILNEVDKQAESRAATEFDADQDVPTAAGDLLADDRVDRTLEHVFTILSLYLEREPLRMAFRALHHEDEHHRGTALEYLETVLSGEVRDAIWPLLGEAGPLAPGRPAEEILAELTAATTEPARAVERPAPLADGDGRSATTPLRGASS